MEFIQESLFGKTYPEHSAVMAVQILGQSLKKSQRPKFQYLNLGDGLKLEWLEGMAVKLPGDALMRNTGVSPNVVKESSLSQILMENVPEKYYLSPKACLGILRRAEKRGKKLSPVLEMALKEQAGLTVAGGVLPEPSVVNGQKEQEAQQGMSIITSSQNQSASNPEAKTEYRESTEMSVQPLIPCRGGQRQPCIAYPDSANTLLAKSNLSFRDDTDNVIVSAVDVRNLNEIPELSATLQAKENGGYSLNYQNPIRISYKVRRFTPTECLRLMGLPDDWLDIEGASDSAKYKAIGNSIAKPPLNFIFGRLVEVLRRVRP